MADCPSQAWDSHIAGLMSDADSYIDFTIELVEGAGLSLDQADFSEDGFIGLLDDREVLLAKVVIPSMRDDRNQAQADKEGYSLRLRAVAIALGVRVDTRVRHESSAASYVAQMPDPPMEEIERTGPLPFKLNDDES